MYYLFTSTLQVNNLFSGLSITHVYGRDPARHHVLVPAVPPRRPVHKPSTPLPALICTSSRLPTPAQTAS